MSNNYRYRWGDTNPVSITYKVGTAVEQGDLCWTDSSDSYTVKPASSVTYGSTIAAPDAPTVSIETGLAVSALASGATDVKVSFNYPWGEGTLSAAATATVTGQHDGIYVHEVALPLDALSRNIYVATAQGGSTFKLYSTDMGGKALVVGYGISRTPPTAVAHLALQATQYLFHQSFCGVAAQAYDGVDEAAYGIKDGLLRVDTGGVFEFTCASASFKVGDLVGPAANGGGTALENQKVVAVAHETLACGRVVRETSSQTTVLVRVFPPKSVSMS